MKLRPLGDKVLIKPTKAVEKTSGGIILPDLAKEEKAEGKVIACGKGNNDVPMQVKVGNNVIFGKYAGDEFIIDGEIHKIVSESDILAVIA
jgi:chaperonin GroES